MLDIFYSLPAIFVAFQTHPVWLQPVLDGCDLFAVGLAPGPGFGALLKEARERQLEGELTTRDQALGWLEAKVRAVTE